MVDEAGFFLAFLIVGIVFGNIIMIYVSLVPFLFLLLSMAYHTKYDITISRNEKVIKARLNETVHVSMTINTNGGTGIYTIYDPLPDHLSLVKGNNFHVYWNDGRKRPVELSYDVEGTKRGIYTLGPAHIECYHNSWIEQPVSSIDEKATRLIVDPERQNIKKMRDPRLLSSMPVPIGAVSKLGQRTTDFTEIRGYRPGDPYRTINWKATARFSMAADQKPYVNEYEKEGKKTVFIFVDAGAWAGHGPEADHVYEHVARAASGIASFYLERNMRVGAYIYNYGELIVPDTGKKQASIILKDLLEIRPGSRDGDNGLKKAVKECSGHLMGTIPLFIIITMAGSKNARDIIEGIKSMRKYSPGARIPHITLLHIKGYNLEAQGPAEETGASLLEFDNLPYVNTIKKTGALVVQWDPRTSSLSQIMMAGFGRRSR
ncbi:MAG TPA: DUF58 domain-containing protein [Methanocella sp.]|uniref:DUF58 domain-containing protein n=1 Tax=Methanocella sp. TaxID=2052833 RepID=UPI002CDB0494|nr:DUF58 domain-containing protein [Methanocella sp.]HTY90000.1 DUF58 domain-containing protein [Methanocella sp.]